jgi:hypothetical protein
MRPGTWRPPCLSACLDDAGDRCSEHQAYGEEMCACAECYTLKGMACEELAARADARTAVGLDLADVRR